MKNRDNEIINYFNKKAPEYDRVDEQVYWVFSDALYKKVLHKLVNDHFDFLKSKSSIRILDLGAGTARWSVNLLNVLHDDLRIDNDTISFDLVDISDKMLCEADKKMRKFNIKFEIHNIDMLDFVAQDNIGKYDIIISFYNALSFIEDLSSLLKNFENILSKNGLFISVLANKYHAMFFSIMTQRLQELRYISGDEGQVRFTDDMPFMKCYSPSELRRMVSALDIFTQFNIWGGPNFIYPGMQETTLNEQSKEIKDILHNSHTFNKLLDLEYKHFFDECMASRSNTLMLYALK